MRIGRNLGTTLDPLVINMELGEAKDRFLLVICDLSFFDICALVDCLSLGMDPVSQGINDKLNRKL